MLKNLSEASLSLEDGQVCCFIRNDVVDSQDTSPCCYVQFPGPVSERVLHQLGLQLRGSQGVRACVGCRHSTGEFLCPMRRLWLPHDETRFESNRIPGN